MLKTIFSSERALTAESAAIAQVGGRAALVPVQLSGVEAINGLFEYRLVLQTPDALLALGGALQGANFNLADMVGREITCKIELEGHGHFVAGLPGGSGAANQGAEIVQRAKHRVHVAIIGNVVTEIGHRRSKKRGNPDRLGAQLRNMRQAAGNTRQIADTVAITVLVTARVNLVNHGVLPPVLIILHAFIP